MKLATREQIIALHTLYSQWEGHSIESLEDGRAARLAWASANVDRQIESFAKLTRAEARMLIDVLKGTLGQPLGRQPRPWRQIDAKDRAHAAGTAGRNDEEPGFIQMASPDDLARIDELLNRLAWSREQFETWLRSSRSPLKLKENSTIRTVGQANRVYWALKAMLTRSGGWKQRGTKRAAQSRGTKQGGGRSA